MKLLTITNLTRAVNLYKMYGPAHSATVEGIAQLCDSILAELADRKEVSFAVAEGRVIVNGEPVPDETPAVAKLRLTLEALAISSISFRSGVDRQELAELVHQLASPPAEKTPLKLPHVSFDKLTYVRRTPETAVAEALVRDVARRKAGTQGPGVDLAKLAESLASTERSPSGDDLAEATVEGLAGASFDVSVALDALSRMISRLDPDTKARLQAAGAGEQKLTPDTLRTLPSRVKALFMAEALLRNVPPALMSAAMSAGAAPTDLMNEVVPEVLARISDPKQGAEMIGRAMAVMAQGVATAGATRRPPRKTIGVMLSKPEGTQAVEALAKSYQVGYWTTANRADLLELAAKKALVAIVVDEESVGDMESFFEEFRYRTKEDTQRVRWAPLPVVMITRRTVMDLPAAAMCYPRLELVPPGAAPDVLAAAIGLGPDDIRTEEPKQDSEADRLELKRAREVVKALLPRELPDIPGLELACYYEPALQVGGDYYDVIRLRGEAYGIAIADVSGKGVPGALVMTTLRSALRMVAAKSHHPKDTLTVTNDLMSQSLIKGMFVSMIYGVYEVPTRLLRIVSSGHTPLLIHRKSMPRPELRDIPGMILGVVDGPTYAATLEEVTLNLQSGDLLLFYTDGLTEAMNRKSEAFGEKRLLDVVARNPGLSASQTVRVLVDAMEAHRAGAEPSDDTCLLAVRVK